MNKKSLIISGIFLFLLTSFLFASECKNCHRNIEQTSKSHDFACISCHGGNNKEKNKDLAHKGMSSGRNPADVSVWDKTCGKCHEYQFKRVKTTIMYTNTGIIKNSILAWGEKFEKIYATSKSENFDEKGNKIKIENIAENKEPAGELYRKFCSMCHIGVDRLSGYRAHHSSGCSACHFSHSASGSYEGSDEQIYGNNPYAKTHKMNILPGDDVCIRCHNRSGRISLSYNGIYDGNNSLVPTKDGLPGPILISGVRNLRHMPKDIHKKYGLECIDCHTSRDLMGDGYIYENMYMQTEITCEDCHGDGKNLPKTKRITGENDSPILESENYAFKIKNGTEMVLTSKGRMFSNVYKEKDKFYLQRKRTGEKIEIKTILNDDNHFVAGHDKLACYSCHSKTVIQCYGCHTTYDKRKKMLDVIKNKETPGLFSEKEDFRKFYPFPLALNQKGEIAPVTPGCQTFFSIIDKNGNYKLKDYVFKLKEGKLFKFAPFYGHNTGEKAISCKGCHGDLAFAGLGAGLISVNNGIITSITICEQKDKPLDALSEIKNGKLNYNSKIVREHSRPLNKDEILRFISANKCIVCHDKGEKRIYGEKINYNILNDNIHKPLIK